MEEPLKSKPSKRLAPIWRTIVEVGFIVFLFYSNLLMGEYTQSRIAVNKGLLWAIEDIFTLTNFLIAIISGLLGHLFFEAVRRRL
jgi:uncharacterized protein with PQ loop repeat